MNTPNACWRTVALAVPLTATLILSACSSGGSGGSDEIEGPIRGDSPFDPATGMTPDAPDGEGSEAQNDESTLVWRPCGGRLECATLPVPINYEDPTGNRVNIALIRLPADPATRVGSLLLNPGGPGGSGVDLARGIAGVLPTAIRQRYDIVGFDPRGVAQSGGVRCGEQQLQAIDGYPVDRDEIESVVNRFSAFAAECVEAFGSYLQFLGSNNVVRDMEQIRIAMGDPELNFLGYSYGTRLSALYLQAFPQTSGRHVLDGSMPPAPELVPLIAQSLEPAQNNISDMLASCTSVDAGCNPDQLAFLLQTRVDLLERSDVDDAEAQLLAAVLQFVSLDPSSNERVIEALIPYLLDGDIEPLRRMFNLVDSGGFEQISAASNIAVMCADDPARPTVDSLEALLADYNQRSDLLAERSVTQSSICAGWPPAIDPIPAIATGQAPAAIVIGGPSDAQTPLVFAEQMAAALGGQFLRSEHLGHTVSFQNRSRCVDTSVIDYLVDGSLPAIDVCGIETPLASGILRSRTEPIAIQPPTPLPTLHEPIRIPLGDHSMP